MSETIEKSEHEIKIGVGVIKQVIHNIQRGARHHLDVIRDALANACAKEVNASEFKITIFNDREFGWSFIFQDDGIGMDYTGKTIPEKPGRLDCFLNLCYSGVSGLEAHEFGSKGIGSVPMYLSKKLEIETKTEQGDSYRVIVDDPVGKLKKNKPELPKPIVFKNPSLNFDHGTIIRVYGYDEGRKHEEYENEEKLRRYLRFRTLLGFTKPKRLEKGFPRVIVKAPCMEEELEFGFPWIKKEGNHLPGQKIGVIKPPIVVTERDENGDEVTVKLKGGFALKPEEFGFAKQGVPQSKGVALIYSSGGAPSFSLNFDNYKPQNFGLDHRFCRFVVESDTNARSPLFKKALRKAFRNVMKTKDYKEWVEHRKKLKEEKSKE